MLDSINDNVRSGELERTYTIESTEFDTFQLKHVRNECDDIVLTFESVEATILYAERYNITITDNGRAETTTGE
jgi:hypothetical protein